MNNAPDMWNPSQTAGLRDVKISEEPTDYEGTPVSTSEDAEITLSQTDALYGIQPHNSKKRASNAARSGFYRSVFLPKFSGNFKAPTRTPPL